MHPVAKKSKNREDLEARVVRAAEAALADHQYVSAIDIFVGMGLLPPAHLESWRKGRVACLERVVQGNLKKISFAMAAFRRWASAKGLQPSETRYVRHTRGGTLDLIFSVSGDPQIEKAYRTHFISPALSASKRQKLEERLSQPPDRVVFQIARDSQCSECGAELAKGELLYMEAGQPLCLACARLDHLEFLPAGDAALTRRAAKYTEGKAVVVRFSRSRGRYERQGLLVEKAALERAEQECTLDAEERARERERGAALRQKQDRELMVRMADAIQRIFPGCPAAEARAIASHTAQRGSGRVGRTATGRNLDEQALTLAVAAALRHRHTDYDSLLASGLDRGLARQQVRDQVDEMLAKWREPLPSV
jgi:hypothetical protein